eukprot:COSAG02_NODE_3214_length_7162_cov_4.502336_2_plen_114_part_00
MSIVQIIRHGPFETPGTSMTLGWQRIQLRSCGCTKAVRTASSFFAPLVFSLFRSWFYLYPCDCPKLACSACFCACNRRYERRLRLRDRSLARLRQSSSAQALAMRLWLAVSYD